MPGNYTVTLVSKGRTLDTKPMRIIMDPMVPLAGAQREAYNRIVMDLHELQRRGAATMTSLTALNKSMNEATTKLKDNASVPADVRAKFDALSKDFEDVRAKFGVTNPPAGGAQGGGRQGGGGGGFGGGGNAANVLGRTGTVKNAIMNIWESPSEAMIRQYNDVRAALPKAIEDANRFMKRAADMNNTLKPYGVTLEVVPPAK
jgi:hypothetical protein